MDAHRFDMWTRARATVSNRRSLLGWSLTAGIAGAFARFAPATAQFGDSGNGSCTYSVTLTSALAGNASVSGSLAFDIDNVGSVETGSLALVGQPPASVAGQATGQTIDLYISLTDGSHLSLTGVAAAPITTCSSPIFGVLANPDTGQLGTWQAHPGQSSQPPAPPPSQAQPARPIPTPTQTPAAAQAPSSCDPPKMLCGANCCPAGSDCYDPASGGCACPDGTEECGIACFPSCADGTPLDPVDCLCPTG